MAAALPDWMMLDRFVFRRDDDDASFRDDEAAAPWARGTTSQGDSFRVALGIVDPPSISRLYLKWPGVPKEGSSCDLVAAHRNLLLLRVTSGPVEKNGSVVHPQDLFLLEARPPSSPDQPPLQLHQIPICTIPLVFHLDDETTRTAQRSFDLHTVGILCRGEEFAVAQLRVTRPLPLHRVEAELCVLRSTVNSPDHSWEVERHLPIMYDNVRSSDLEQWRTDIVVPFEKSLCWVNYSLGGILFCKVLNERPAIKYLPLPIRGEPGDRDLHHLHDHVHVKCCCCCLCTTQDGHKLVYINVKRRDRKPVGPLRLATGFSVTGHVLRKAERGRMEWDKVFSITSDQLWDLGDFPQGPLILPLVDMLKPNVLYFLVSEEAKHGLDKVYVLTFDTTTKEVSILPYITEDCKDADFVRRKFYLLDPFIPSQLPRFLGYFSSEQRTIPLQKEGEETTGTKSGKQVSVASQP